MDRTAAPGDPRELLLPRQVGPLHDPSGDSVPPIPVQEMPVGAPSGGNPPRAAGHLLRRPIYDGTLTLAGYELVVDGASTEAEQVDAVTAALTEVPPAVLGAGGVLFVPLPRALLAGGMPVPTAPGTVVLEVHEKDLGDAAVVSGLTALADAGHRLGLVGAGWSPALRSFLSLFRVARADVSQVGTAGLAALATRLREQRLELFVQGVETLGQLEACRRIGAEYLAGSLVSRPPVVAERGLAPSQLACLRLATALVRSEVDLTEVELAVRSDPGLTMRVLKAVNSVAGPVRQRVSSIRQAVVLLGPRTLLGSVLTAGLSQDGADTPPEAVEAVLVRARMCELVAGTVLPVLGTAMNGSEAFTVGLVAGLDALLGVSPTEIVAELPVDEAVERAVLSCAGPLGSVLADVFAYEQAQTTRLLDVAGMRAVFLASLTWAVPLVSC